MNFLEKDLEEIIFNSNRDQLSERGLIVNGKIKRQLNLGKFGILDLLTIEKEQEGYGSNLVFTIYELKKDCIGISAFLQALSYARGIKLYLEKKRRIYHFSIKIVLIGKTIDTKGSFCFIPDLFQSTPPFLHDGQITDINFYTFKYGIEGISFKEENNYLMKNPFNEIQ